MAAEAEVKFQCPSCGQALSAPAEFSGCQLPCPKCNTTILVPGAGVAPSTTGGADRFCAICQTSITASAPATACPACSASYHTECWEENGGCAVYGCTQVPATELRDTLEIPVSYWGQEHKNCPVCQSKILAAAVRCRVCGTNFGSARPQDATEFQQRALQTVLAPKLKKKVVWLFVFCVLPCTSPIATILCAIWYSARHRDIRSLPGLYSALAKIALIVGFGQMALTIIVLVVLALKPH